MRILIPNEEARKLTNALAAAGQREIGGQLFGEQLAPSNFRITDLTIQNRRGTFARFVVDVLQAARDAFRFFERTARDYARYNYIGEWHSHPSFDVRPSATDVDTMRRLVADPEFRGHFAALVVVRLDDRALRFGAWLFDPHGNEQDIDMTVEE